MSESEPRHSNENTGRNSLDERILNTRTTLENTFQEQIQRLSVRMRNQRFKDSIITSLRTTVDKIFKQDIDTDMDGTATIKVSFLVAELEEFIELVFDETAAPGAKKSTDEVKKEPVNNQDNGPRSEADIEIRLMSQIEAVYTLLSNKSGIANPKFDDKFQELYDSAASLLEQFRLKGGVNSVAKLQQLKSRLEKSKSQFNEILSKYVSALHEEKLSALEQRLPFVEISHEEWGHELRIINMQLDRLKAADIAGAGRLAIEMKQMSEARIKLHNAAHAARFVGGAEFAKKFLEINKSDLETICRINGVPELLDLYTANGKEIFRENKDIVNDSFNKFFTEKIGKGFSAFSDSELATRKLLARRLAKIMGINSFFEGPIRNDGKLVDITEALYKNRIGIQQKCFEIRSFDDPNEVINAFNRAWHRFYSDYDNIMELKKGEKAVLINSDALTKHIDMLNYMHGKEQKVDLNGMQLLKTALPAMPASLIHMIPGKEPRDLINMWDNYEFVKAKNAWSERLIAHSRIYSALNDHYSSLFGDKLLGDLSYEYLNSDSDIVKNLHAVFDLYDRNFSNAESAELKATLVVRLVELSKKNEVPEYISRSVYYQKADKSTKNDIIQFWKNHLTPIWRNKSRTNQQFLERIFRFPADKSAFDAALAYFLNKNPDQIEGHLKNQQTTEVLKDIAKFGGWFLWGMLTGPKK